MFTRMLKLPESVRNSYDVSSLKRVMHAAAPCPVEIKKQMIDWWGPIVDEYYASSEAIGSTLITAEEWLAHPGSVGKSMMSPLHILDEDGNELPPGQAGEIYFEGGFDFEYLNDPEKTAKSRDKHGWKTVGDIGYLDEDGYLYLTDRRHHMIISGGVNIYPQEAENMLVTHPKVMDAAVFGIPDDEMGQSVKGVVQTVDPADATDEFADELLTWLRDRLSHYKCPAVDLVRGAVAAHRHRQAVQAGADREVLVGQAMTMRGHEPGGPYFDDLEVGQVFDWAPSMTLTAGAAAVHQSIVGDRLRLALDAELAMAVTGATARACASGSSSATSRSARPRSRPSALRPTCSTAALPSTGFPSSATPSSPAPRSSA